jgi:hypothetical protein
MRLRHVPLAALNTGYTTRARGVRAGRFFYAPFFPPPPERTKTHRVTESDITSIEREYGIELTPKTTAPRVITGHIDFIQVRNGAVHILDYKPDARTNRPIAQLTIYALAISRLTGIRLFDIKCSWFNEHEYCEFFPRKLLAGGGKRRAA